jgi:DNA-directed RNA polymerase subunit RPC12/RpoP
VVRAEGYTVSYLGIDGKKLTFDSKEGFVAELATEDDVYEMMMIEEESKIDDMPTVVCDYCGHETYATGNEFERCEMCYEPLYDCDYSCPDCGFDLTAIGMALMCPQCGHELDSAETEVKSTGVTWRTIYQELGEEKTIFYMEAVHDETNEYPDWDDDAPDWVVRRMTQKAAS